MNHLKALVPVLQCPIVTGSILNRLSLTAQTKLAATCTTAFRRDLSSQCASKPVNHVVQRGSIQTLFNHSSVFSPLLTLPPQVSVQQTRTYKVRYTLKKRCKGCYFVKRQGRMYVECHLKPRHKQMQQLSKRALWKDDYSEGEWKRALYWKFQNDRWYWKGDTKYARHNWVADRIGKEL